MDQQPKYKQENIYQLLEQERARTARRDTLAKRLAEPGKPVRMISTGGRRALAQADMAEPGQFRITLFDDRGPSGHMNFNSLIDAITEGLRMGYGPEETA